MEVYKVSGLELRSSVKGISLESEYFEASIDFAIEGVIFRHVTCFGRSVSPSPLECCLQMALDCFNHTRSALLSPRRREVLSISQQGGMRLAAVASRPCSHCLRRLRSISNSNSSRDRNATGHTIPSSADSSTRLPSASTGRHGISRTFSISSRFQASKPPAEPPNKKRKIDMEEFPPERIR